jgi:hypothetical protein
VDLLRRPDPTNLDVFEAVRAYATRLARHCIWPTRPRISGFMNKFRKLGFIEYNRARAETSGTTRSRLNSRLWRACPEHPPSRGCSFGLVPVLVRVRRSRGKQRTPPATVCSTAHARGRTRRRFPLRARPRRVLSCGGRCRHGRPVPRWDLDTLPTMEPKRPSDSWAWICRFNSFSPIRRRRMGCSMATSRRFPVSTCQIHRGLDARERASNGEAGVQASEC